MLPALGNESSFGYADSAGGTSATAGITGVTAGSTICVLFSQYVGATGRLYTVSDDVNTGPYYEAIGIVSGGNRHSRIFYKKNSVSGTVNVTALCNINAAFTIFPFEIKNVDTRSPLDTVSAFEETVATQTHSCAQVGEIDTADNVFVVSIGTFNVDDENYTKGANFNLFDFADGSFFSFAQYRISATALTDERCQFDSATNLRTIVGCCAAFKAPSSSSGSINVTLTIH